MSRPIPTRFYKRRFAISRHALERFRERVDEEFRHRDDVDLGNLLDDRVFHAESTYQVRDPRAPDAITHLRAITCHHAPYYAVVRDSTVVTVLDEEMARNNFGGQWALVLNTPFEVLRGLKIQKPSTPATPPPAPSATAADPLAEAGAAYALARRQKRECAEAVTALTAELEQATAALREAETAVDAAHQRLTDLAGDGEEAT